jgi:hypothetical protein
MYQVSLLDSAGRRTVVDFHELRLDDGTKAFDLLAEPAILYRKLRAMKVPEIAADMGSHQLMVALGRHRAAAAPAPIVHKRQQPNIGDAA